MILTYIFIISILLIVTIIIYRKKNQSNPIITPIVKTIECGTIDGNTIKTCKKEDSITGCETCRCTSDPSLIMGCMECKTVNSNSDFKHLFIPREDCTGDNVEWNETTNSCVLKDGNYCLPKIVNDINCNKFTGRKLLALNPITNLYEWKCVCKEPTKLSNIGTLNGDCDHINLCGIDSSDNPSGNRGLVYSLDETVFWDAKTSNWDPLDDTKIKCKCNPGEVYNPIFKSCMPNSCLPGQIKPNDSNSCNCPTGYIDCSSITYRYDPSAPTGQYNTGICTIPSCVPDPCVGNSGDSINNYYDADTNSCICNKSKNFTNTYVSNNGFGQVCKDVCGTRDNPCGSRGDCYLYNIDEKDTVWKIITAESKKFLIYLKDINGLVLQNNLSLSTTAQKFYFETHGAIDNNRNPITVQCTRLYPNDNYKIKVSPDNGITFTYVNFETKTNTNNKENGSVVTLKKNKDYEENQYNIYVVSKIIIANQTAKTISLVSNFDKTPRCKNCKSPFKQDTNLYCRDRYAFLGEGCSRSSDCEPGIGKCCLGIGERVCMDDDELFCI